jgi:hypothetical protein
LFFGNCRIQVHLQEQDRLKKKFGLIDAPDGTWQAASFIAWNGVMFNLT